MGSSMHICIQMLKAVIEHVYNTQLKFIAQVYLSACNKWQTEGDYLWLFLVGGMRLLHDSQIICPVGKGLKIMMDFDLWFFFLDEADE